MGPDRRAHLPDRSHRHADGDSSAAAESAAPAGDSDDTGGPENRHGSWHPGTGQDGSLGGAAIGALVGEIAGGAVGGPPGALAGGVAGAAIGAAEAANEESGEPETTQPARDDVPETPDQAAAAWAAYERRPRKARD